jgi:predicted lipid carrier protein YhbT
LIPLPLPPLPLPAKLNAALQALRGKVVRLEIAGLGFGPQLTLGAFGLRPALGRPDVTIRASVQDYVSLALKREDPDSLFFARRLVVEGDTDLGLIIKNALDSIG